MNDAFVQHRFVTYTAITKKSTRMILVPGETLTNWNFADNSLFSQTLPANRYLSPLSTRVSFTNVSVTFPSISQTISIENALSSFPKMSYHTHCSPSWILSNMPLSLIGLFHLSSAASPNRFSSNMFLFWDPLALSSVLPEKRRTTITAILTDNCNELWWETL